MQQLSAPQIGCTPDTIEIENEGQDAAGKPSWDARCNRKMYRCTQSGSTVSCQFFRPRGGMLASLSAGMVGCGPEEIEIDDDSGWGFGPRSWKAYCRGVVFQCSGASRVGASCAPVVPPQGGVYPQPQPAPQR